MARILRFRSRRQRHEEFLDEVRRQVAAFTGTLEERKRFIADAVRRGMKLDLDKDVELMQKLDRIACGFLDPEYHE